MRHHLLILFLLFVTSATYSQVDKEDAFWLRDKIKSNSRVDNFGKEEYVVKIDSCIISFGQTSTVIMPSVGKDVFHHVYTLFIKDIFLLQLEETKRDCRIKIRTKDETINHYWAEPNKREKVDELLLMLNKDSKDNGDFYKIVELLKTIVQSCGGNVKTMEL